MIEDIINLTADFYNSVDNFILKANKAESFSIPLSDKTDSLFDHDSTYCTLGFERS